MCTICIFHKIGSDTHSHLRPLPSASVRYRLSTLNAQSSAPTCATRPCTATCPNAHTPNSNSVSQSCCVGAKSDQYVNIYSFIVRCDRRWLNTQRHRVYTGSGNVPYVQFESVGDFIPEPRCSKFAVGLQMEGRKIGVQEVWSDSSLKGRE